VKVWIDAQLSPALAPWLESSFGVEARAVSTLGLRDAKDREIFFAARTAEAVILTKDSDFVRLLEEHGPPPSILWITAGNTSNSRMKELLQSSWTKAITLIGSGEALVEIQSRE
jgi:predicted nuclease of predicted toxin-antitoxin system